MPFELELQSTDAARPNEALLEQILARQNELIAVLQKDYPSVETVKVEPQASFPTGLEVFIITVAVGFATRVATGVAKGAGGEIGKAIGEEAGKRIGMKIRRWIQDAFPDVDVKKVTEK